MNDLPGKPGVAMGRDLSADRLPRLERDLAVDVAVLGGGIAGLTGALLLARAAPRSRWSTRARSATA